MDTNVFFMAFCHFCQGSQGFGSLYPRLYPFARLVLAQIWDRSRSDQAGGYGSCHYDSACTYGIERCWNLPGVSQRDCCVDRSANDVWPNYCPSLKCGQTACRLSGLANHLGYKQSVFRLRRCMTTNLICVKALKVLPAIVEAPRTKV